MKIPSFGKAQDLSKRHNRDTSRVKSVSKIASDYLAILKNDGVTLEPVQHISREVGVPASSETAAKFLERIKAQLKKQQFDTVTERTDVESPKVVLVTGRSRAFCGFLRGHAVFSFDFRLASQFTFEEADQIEQQLTALGYETQRHPSLP